MHYSEEGGKRERRLNFNPTNQKMTVQIELPVIWVGRRGTLEKSVIDLLRNSSSRKFHYALNT